MVYDDMNYVEFKYDKINHLFMEFPEYIEFSNNDKMNHIAIFIIRILEYYFNNTIIIKYYYDSTIKILL